MGKDWEANDAEDDDKLCSSVLLGKSPAASKRAEVRHWDHLLFRVAANENLLFTVHLLATDFGV